MCWTDWDELYGGGYEGVDSSAGLLTSCFLCDCNQNRWRSDGCVGQSVPGPWGWGLKVVDESSLPGVLSPLPLLRSLWLLISLQI